MDKWASQSTIGDFSMVEMNIALRTIELWEAGKIDMVLCAYSSTMPLLDEKGVPNYFLYPVKNQLESQIKELLAQIKLEKYRENLPVAIAIADRNKTSGEKSDDSVQDAVQKIIDQVPMSEEIESIVNFVKASERGIVK